MTKKKKPRCKTNMEQQQENNKLRNRLSQFIVRSQRSTGVQQNHEMAATLQVPNNADVDTEPEAIIAAKISSESTDYSAGKKTNSGEDEIISRD